jgi:hypothetical protein
MRSHPVIEALEKAGVTVVLMPPDSIKLRPGPSIAPPEVIRPLVEEVRQRKPEVLAALRQQEFNRLYAMVKASVSRVADGCIEGGIAVAQALGMWPRLMALESAIDRAVKNLDEPALLGSLEAFEKAWEELRDRMAHLRRPAQQVEATA